MRFENPWALLALIAIPILIIIYILKNKFKEERHSSTYIWEVSEKFLKKRNPLSNIEHLLALIVQILTIAALSIALAHPVFILKESADNIVFVLDGSGSMNIVDSNADETRFDLAKEKILSVVDAAPDGCTYTLILSTDETRNVCERVDDKSRFEMYLDTVECTYKSSDLTEAIANAQNLFSNGDCNLCYLATDKLFNQYDAGGNLNLANITLLSVAGKESNYFLKDIYYSESDSATAISLGGSIYAYEPASIEDKLNLTLKFYVDGGEVGEQQFECTNNSRGDDNPTIFSVEELPVDSFDFENIKVEIVETDAFLADNAYTLYTNDEADTDNVLLVTGNSTEYYLKMAFKSAGANVTSIKASQYDSYIAEYNAKLEAGTLATSEDDDGKFDMIVFNCYTPSSIPTCGAVWFFGIDSYVDGLGFTVQTSFSNDGDGEYLSYTHNDGTLYEQFTRNVTERDIIINKYIKYSLSGDFTTVLTNDRNDPLIFGGRNDNNQREVVFAFDLRDSDLALQFDFLALIRNFMDYSHPADMTEFQYVVGDTALINVNDDIDEIEIENRDTGETEILYTNGSEYMTYSFVEGGSYWFDFKDVDNNAETKYKVFASYPTDECNPYTIGEDIFLTTSALTIRGDGLLDNILPIIIVAAVFFAADWILYTHEQY